VLVALAVLTGCGGGKETSPSSPSSTAAASTSAAAMPQKATFIAKLPATEGHPAMVLAVTVDGDKAAAYACNNKDDEAWFFGPQQNGSMNLTSKYQDTLKTTFEAGKLKTILTMNEVTYTGTAEPAAGPAGSYTVTAGDARATWIVLPDNSVVGVTSPNSKNDREVIDKINAQQQNFKDQVRQARLNRQLEQSAQLNTTNFTSTLNSTTVTAVEVTGNMTSAPP
jgi:hypothetical protein